MKNLYSFILLLFFTLYGYAQQNSDFYLANNGVTCMCPDADFGDTGTLNINGVDKTFTKRTRAQLDALIAADQTDPEIALTCTSGITDMSELLRDKASFNQNINSWDVSNVTYMLSMFYQASSFDQPIHDWDVSNVTDLGFMFYGASSFNKPLNNWDVASVTNMLNMFDEAESFNESLNDWDVSSVTNMSHMFRKASSFNQPLNNWDVSSVTNMSLMFRRAELFNQPLNNWDVSNVTDMRFILGDTSFFNQPLNNWDVSSVTNMKGMFSSATAFDQPLNYWDVSNVTDMSYMFLNAYSYSHSLNDWNVSSVTDMSNMLRSTYSLDQPLNNWDVSNVSNMSGLFANVTLDQTLNDWDVSSVTNMSGMFAGTTFNEPLNNWDVSNVTDMSSIFRGSRSFNQPLNDWDVSSVTNMSEMFIRASSFNQNLSSWNFNGAVTLADFLSNSGLSKENYDLLLASFDDQDLQNKTLGADGLKYCNESSRDELINTKGWTINGDSLSEDCITCEAPVNLEVLQVNASSAEISFDSSQSGSINVLVMNQGDDILSDMPLQDYQINGIQTGTQSFFQLDLKPNKAYDLYIRLNCSTTDSSEYSGPLNFQTLCDEIDIPVGNTQQTFCTEPTVENVTVTGQNLQYYEDSNLTSLIQTSDILNDGQIIYVTQTINNCESDALEIQINIEDTEAPVPNSSSLDLYDSGCNLELSLLPKPTATDNCDGSITANLHSFRFSNSNEDLIIITWRFADSSGNIKDQEQLVSTQDNVSPEPELSNLPKIESSCEVTTLEKPLAYDDCDDSEIVGETETSFPIINSTTILWTYTDSSGNISSQEQEVIIDDTESPMINAVEEIDLDLVEGVASLTPELIDLGSTDNCGITAQDLSQSAFGCDDLELASPIIIVYTVQDSSGNTTSVDVSVTLTDSQSSCETLNTEESSSVDLNIYPVPARDFISIKMDGVAEINQVNIFDVRGRLVKKVESTSNFEKIDVSNLQAGNYFVRITSKTNKVLIKQIIIEK